MPNLQSAAGFFALIVLAWILSENRKKTPWRTVGMGAGLQILLAVVLTRTPLAVKAIKKLNVVVLTLQEATNAGTSFVFGYVGGGKVPFEITSPENSFVLAFQALPLVLVVSAISSLLFYWKVLPLVVRVFSWILAKTMRISGCEGVAASANVFVGMIEAPLFIRPYISKMTRSEIFSMMVCGMATIAGTMMVLYAGILKPVIGPSSLGHILVASLISCPAALMVAKVMVPEEDIESAVRIDEIEIKSEAAGSMDAVTRGVAGGVKILINIIAMLIVILAFIFIINRILGLVSIQKEPLSLERMLGWVMAPVVWLIGIPWQEAQRAGSLMGVKTIANELFAYLKLGGAGLSERSNLIMTYAMCGFANFGSLGIMLGGLGTMAPEKRSEIVSLGFKSIAAGTISTLMTGAVIGILN